MSTHLDTPRAQQTAATEPTAARHTGRGWALAGVGAGVCAIAGTVSSGLVSAVYDEDLRGNTQGVADKLADLVPQMLAFHTFAMLAAVLGVVFAVGLYRRLASALPTTSTAPLLAFAGLLGTAVVGVIGTGLDTEFIFAFAEEGLVDPANAALYNHWIGTVPWCWVLTGLSGLAIFAAARAGGAPRWIGWVGLVLGGLSLLLGISPLQYMAGMTGPLWLLVTALGFTLGDRAFRS